MERSMRTLAMIKMEKNFSGHLKKHYPRKPYEHYTIGQLLDRIEEEYNDAIVAYQRLDYEGLAFQLADISNLVDYIFEQATEKIHEARKEVIG